MRAMGTDRLVSIFISGKSSSSVVFEFRGEISKLCSAVVLSALLSGSSLARLISTILVKDAIGSYIYSR